jgi:hypothetical protein
VAVLFRWTGIDPPFLVRINRGHGVCGFDVGVFGYRAGFGNGDYRMETEMNIIIDEYIYNLDDEIKDDCGYFYNENNQAVYYFIGDFDKLADLCSEHDKRIKDEKLKAFTIYRHPDHPGYWGFEY